MPGDGHTLLRKVDFDKDTIPTPCLAQHIGGHIRIGLFDCNPCFDHIGTRLDEIGLPYSDFCCIFNNLLAGKMCNAPDQREDIGTLAFRAGFNWEPFRIVKPDSTVVNRTIGTPFGPEGWLRRAGTNVGMAGHNKSWYVSQACRQVSKCTRHLAGTLPSLGIFPHGWASCAGVVEHIGALHIYT